mgnify:CR=1
MNCYFDILIKPDAEMRENVLMNKVYSKFHKALFTLSANNIGVSFPKYEILLGKVLRVHGEHSALNDLQGLSWLGGLVGYCEISAIQNVPEIVQYRVISRIQPKMSNSKLNRLVKRGSISNEEIKGYKAKMFSKGLDNPYVELESTSSGERYRRYFQFGRITDESSVGEFDEFGLSKTASIPWF